MTAINVFLDDPHNHITISTDTAAVDRKGVYRQRINKVAIIPHLPAVIAVSGWAAVLTMASARLNTCSSFDQAIDEAPERLRPVAIHRARIVIAGWSKRREMPEAYLFTCSGFPRLSVAPECITSTLISPFDEGLEQRCAQHGVVLDRTDAYRDAFLIMNEQRALPHLGPFFKRPANAIGGDCQLTTIGQFGIESRIVGGWPDVMGQPIQP